MAERAYETDITYKPTRKKENEFSTTVDLNKPQCAVLYGRYSSRNQKDASIEQQFADCRRFAEDHGLKIIGEYADRAVSGRKDKRNEFQRMIRDAQRGRFQFVITWKVDRFARNRYDAALYKGRLKSYDVRVLYAKDVIPEGSAGILLESVLEGTAEFYSAALSENIKRGMDDNAQNCMLNGRPPLGYKKGPDGRYAIDPPSAAIVREIFNRYAANETITDICSSLNERGIRSSTGVLFNKNSMHTILHNERYIGIYICSKYRIEGGIPPIIDKELFDLVQSKTNKSRRSRPGGRGTVDYLLTGKLYCGYCEKPMVGESGTGKKGRLYSYYICTTKKREHACNKKTVQKEWLEDFVVQKATEVIFSDEMINTLADNMMQLQLKERNSGILQALQSQLAGVKSSIKNLMNAIEQGIITPTTKARLLELENEQDTLQISISEEKAERPMLTRDHIIFWFETFRKGDTSSITYKQKIIDTFIHSIYLYDDEIRIAFNFSDKNNTITCPFINKLPSANLPDTSALAPPPCSDYVRLSPPNFFEKKFGSKSFIFGSDLIQMDSRFFMFFI